LLFYNYLTEIGIQFSIDLRRIIHAEVLWYGYNYFTNKPVW
jgi:hypothetical protein